MYPADGYRPSMAGDPRFPRGAQPPAFSRDGTPEGASDSVPLPAGGAMAGGRPIGAEGMHPMGLEGAMVDPSMVVPVPTEKGVCGTVQSCI